MSMLPLPLVLADQLPREVRQVLRPGEALQDCSGAAHALPSSFLRVESWSHALETVLTPHFKLWELIGVDVREAPPLRSFPRYVPCALVLLAAGLELFRLEVDTHVHVAANGGYRSPGHTLSRHASRHCWGTAANIYRIGDTYLDSREEIEKYAAIARRVIPGVWVRPFGQEDGQADDHLHIDIGYTVFDPVNGQDSSQSTEAS
ncbi:MAG: Peptidase [Ramlibacter sp.]|nr:Peptidase [Ramlibacter sp.]